jgi:hypothetical protein
VAEPVPRPGVPWWGWVLLLGIGALIVWWFVRAVFASVVWGIRTLVMVVIIGGVIYLVLAATGRRPGRT